MFQIGDRGRSNFHQIQQLDQFFIHVQEGHMTPRAIGQPIGGYGNLGRKKSIFSHTLILLILGRGYSSFL
jgi:hypothetical protein